MKYYESIPSPSFVLEEALLLKNLKLIEGVQNKADISVILALKGFAMWRVFPLVRKYLKGATASSLYEARLVFEEMGTRAHTYAPAYIPEEFEEVLNYSSHITFNSISQYEFYRNQVEHHKDKVSIGLRVNPGYSVVDVDLYNPAAPDSRLGIPAEQLQNGLPPGVEGLHFHALCESSAADLEAVLMVFETRFAHLFPHLKWVNFGGGHLMTREGYDIEHLIRILSDFKQRYGLEVILEPGSAVAWETGFLLATVLDVVENGGVKTLMLDVSFTAHMPDTLEMPYRPAIRNASKEGSGPFRYRIGGMSCLAGDYMMEYGFETAVNIGDQLILEDMIHYTMVKTNMFNGVKHPSICILKEDQTVELVRVFNYEDYKNRLS